MNPLEKDFCERAEWYNYPDNAHYDLCVVDCDGRRCTETAWETYCGCKKDRPKQKGVMEYRVGSTFIYISSTKYSKNQRKLQKYFPHLYIYLLSGW